MANHYPIIIIRKIPLSALKGEIHHFSAPNSPLPVVVHCLSQSKILNPLTGDFLPARLLLVVLSLPIPPPPRPQPFFHATTTKPDDFSALSPGLAYDGAALSPHPQCDSQAPPEHKELGSAQVRTHKGSMDGGGRAVSSFWSAPSPASNHMFSNRVFSVIIIISRQPGSNNCRVSRIQRSCSALVYLSLSFSISFPSSLDSSIRQRTRTFSTFQRQFDGLFWGK